jgi:3-deoxy-D-manno-octulosonic-acid transferase
LRALYTLLLRLALPLVLLRLWWRGRREAGYRDFVAERFGRYAGDVPERLLWIHAVSVGEVRAALPLVRALQEALADHRVLLTCTTASGRAMAKQVYGETVQCAYLPYDYPDSVQRFLERFRPRLGILMETEIWPNLIAECATLGVPLVLANARMSEKSASGYERWHALFWPAFASLDAVCAQSEADAVRLRGLGAKRVHVSGNLKFDVQLDEAQLERGRLWRRQLARPVLLLASTREGEEALLLGALPQWDGELLVIVVPRHPQRFDALARLADARRSRDDFPGPKQRIYLGDSMGEMGFYYGVCDVAVIGGSFAPLGGQNLIEALAAGAAVVTGPSMYNFADATRLALEAGAVVQAADAPSAVRIALDLVANPSKREAMGAAGKALCEANRGATARHLEVCLDFLKKKS